MKKFTLFLLGISIFGVFVMTILSVFFEFWSLELCIFIGVFFSILCTSTCYFGKDFLRQLSRKNIRYNNWIMRNFFEIIGFPILLLTVFIGLNANILYDNAIDNNEKTKIFTYKEGQKTKKYPVSLFDRLKLIASKKQVVIQEISQTKNIDSTKKYSQILLIDQTHSTKEFGKNTTRLNTKLKNDLELDKNSNHNIATLLKYQLFKNIYTGNNIDSIYVIYYGGVKKEKKNNSSNRKKTFSVSDTKSNNKWVSLCQSEKKKQTIKTLDSLARLEIFKSTKYQKTNFNEILDTLNAVISENKANNKVIVSIISDFINESTPPNKSQFDGLIKSNIHQFNLIYLNDGNSNIDYIYSKKCYRKFIDYFDSDKVDVISINIDKYNDKELNDDNYQRLSYKLKKYIFPKYNANKTKVIFYAPKFDNRNRPISKASIYFPKNKFKYWEIESTNNDDDESSNTLDVVSYYKNLDTIKYNFSIHNNKLLKLDESDTILTIEIPKELNRNYFLELIDAKGQFYKYKIDFQDYIPTGYLNILIISFNMFVFVFLLLLLFTFIKNLLFYHNSSNVKGYLVIDMALVFISFLLLFLFESYIIEKYGLDVKYYLIEIMKIILMFYFIMLTSIMYIEVEKN